MSSLLKLIFSLLIISNLYGGEINFSPELNRRPKLDQQAHEESKPFFGKTGYIGQYLFPVAEFIAVPMVKTVEALVKLVTSEGILPSEDKQEPSGFWTSEKLGTGLRLMLLTSCIISGVNATGENCIKPSGSYELSCVNIQVFPYKSRDPVLGEVCCFTGHCAQTHECLGNQYFRHCFPKGTLVTGVTNQNGTLYYGGKPFDIPESLTPTELTNSGMSCNQPPLGSYQKTCEGITVVPYVPTDSGLKRSRVCRATMSCKDLKGKKGPSKNIVYWELSKEANLVKPIENCDGKLKVGPDDRECLDEKRATEIGKTTASSHIEL